MGAHSAGSEAGEAGLQDAVDGIRSCRDASQALHQWRYHTDRSFDSATLYNDERQCSDAPEHHCSRRVACFLSDHLGLSIHHVWKSICSLSPAIPVLPLSSSVATSGFPLFIFPAYLLWSLFASLASLAPTSLSWRTTQSPLYIYNGVIREFVTVSFPASTNWH